GLRHPGRGEGRDRAAADPLARHLPAGMGRRGLRGPAPPDRGRPAGRPGHGRARAGAVGRPGRRGMTATDVRPAPAAPAPASTAPRPRRRLRGGLPALAFLVLLCAAWQVMSALLDSVLVPGVPRIAAELVEIVVDGSFAEQLGITVLRVGLGFALAFVVAVAVGIVMGRSELARRFFEPAVLLGLTIPGLVWALLCVIWFGIELINP